MDLKFFLKKFSIQEFPKTFFLRIFNEKCTKSSDPAELLYAREPIDSSKFFVMNYFKRLIIFLKKNRSKNIKNVMFEQKNFFGRKFFLSESIQNHLKRKFMFFCFYSLAPKPLKITSDYCLALKGFDQTLACPGAKSII